jgi:rhodanese-related sulfurtransferase
MSVSQNTHHTEEGILSVQFRSHSTHHYKCFRPSKLTRVDFFNMYHIHKQLNFNIMKKLFLLFLLPAFILGSCSSDSTNDPTPSTDPQKILTDYMVAENLDLDDVLSGWIVPAPATVAEVDGFLADRYVIDIRSATDYAAGHIQGAVNSTLADILTTAQAADKQILVVCYSGQSAGHAVMALRLSGYSDAQVLKFGMSGWSSQTSASWDNNTGNVAEGNSNWTDAATAASTFKAPTFTSASTDGATILAERVSAMLGGGFKSVKNTDVLAAPNDYYINVYWPETAVATYGCINTAVRVSPMTIADNTILNLNPDETVVTYCWTGQTSSMVTAYLNVIGYNALSL